MVDFCFMIQYLEYTDKSEAHGIATCSSVVWLFRVQGDLRDLRAHCSAFWLCFGSNLKQNLWLESTWQTQYYVFAHWRLRSGFYFNYTSLLKWKYISKRLHFLIYRVIIKWVQGVLFSNRTLNQEHQHSWVNIELWRQTSGQYLSLINQCGVFKCTPAHQFYTSI